MKKKMLGTVLAVFMLFAATAVLFADVSEAATAFTFRYTWVSAKKVTAGKSVTARAVTAGNTSGVKYRFRVGINGKRATVVQNTSTKNSAVIKTGQSGTYTVYVDVFLKNGKTVTRVNKFEVSRPWRVDRIGGSSGVKVGASLGLYPQVAGSTGGLQYRYTYMKSGQSKWTVIRNYSKVKNSAFVPSAPGTYTVRVEAKDAYGNVVIRSKKITAVAYKGKVSVNKNVTTTGNNIKLTASGAPSGTKFKFVACYNNWNRWHVIRNFSTTSAINYVPKYSGRLEIYVDMEYKGHITTFKSGVITVQKGAELSHELLSLINKERAAYGLAPLKWDTSIDTAALIRAKELKTKFAHERPDGRDIYTAGNFNGEIIARGYSTYEKTVAAWMASPIHKFNILGGMTGYRGMSAAKYQDRYVVLFK